MNVVFDGAALGERAITGVGRAFVNGLEAYANAYGPCVLLLPHGSAPLQLPLVRIVAAPRGAIRRQLGLPRLLRDLATDILHSSVTAVPLRARAPTIASAHDLPWLHPELGERSSLRQRFVTRRALTAAAAVIAPSQFTADDVRRSLSAPTDKVHVIAHGTTLGAEPTHANLQARNGDWIALGDARPRKNRERLQAAHAAARRTCPELPDLRFVGPPDDYVDEAEKLRLLMTCRAVLHCSRFEGFGMPVLEALAHGAPLLCSDLPPHREIAGSCAHFVDPDSVAAMTAAMLALQRESRHDHERVHAGWRRAQAFAPHLVAARWRELHEQLHAARSAERGEGA